MEKVSDSEFVRVTEAAALSASKWIGKGDEKAADAAAVDAMRKVFDTIDIDGTIVIGEGERDQAPMLYIGEKVGRGLHNKVDIALDPLEGTTLVAQGWNNAISVMAVANAGCLFHAPDVYMEKLAVGPKGRGILSLEDPAEVNLPKLAIAMDKPITELTVCILNRPRHEKLITSVRNLGCRIYLIPDGDIIAAMATCMQSFPIDILLGIGGAPEGVIAATALKCLGGELQCKLLFTNDQERQRATDMGIKDLNQYFMIDTIAKGDVIFCATGITDGEMLDGIQVTSDHTRTHSLVLNSYTNTRRWISMEHNNAIRYII